MYLSIVIPAYNEAGRIGEALDKLIRYLKVKPYDYEIIVIDDGSNDTTREVVLERLKGFPFSLITNDHNMGKGYSVRRGMLEARGERILFTDADFSAPIEELDKLLGAIEAGCDIAIGSRALKDSQVIVRQTWLREHMGKTFNFIARFLTFKGIKDSQCGFKCFRHSVARELFSRQKLRGFSFDAEIIYLAQGLGYKIREIPVNWVNSPHSKVGLVSDSAKMFLDLIKIRWLHRGVSGGKVKAKVK